MASFPKSCFLFALMAASVLHAMSETTDAPSGLRDGRQLVTSAPLLDNALNAGGWSNVLSLIIPIVLILGFGSLILPVIAGVFLLGNGGSGFGGFFGDYFGKKRSTAGSEEHPLFSTEKLIELLQTVTKALDEVAKDS